MAVEPKEGDTQLPTIPERLRAVLGDYRPTIERFIRRARVVDSPKSNEELTQIALKDLPEDVEVAGWEFRTDETGEAVHTILHYGKNLFNKVLAKTLTEKAEEEASWDLMEADSTHDYLRFLELEDPAEIKIVDWTDTVEPDDYFSYFPDADEAPEEAVTIPSRQVRYTYSTDLPGIKFVMQFPTHCTDEENAAEKRSHEGEDYDFPAYLTGLHSIRLTVSPEAYAESVKDAPTIAPE